MTSDNAFFGLIFSGDQKLNYVSFHLAIKLENTIICVLEHRYLVPHANRNFSIQFFVST
jgi:hypothetical protein